MSLESTGERISEKNGGRYSVNLGKTFGISVLVGLGCLLPLPSMAAPDAAAGKVKFQKSICVQCHGLEAQGMAGMGMDLRTAPLIKAGQASAIEKFIASGHRGTDQYPGGMPPNGGIQLTQEDRANIAAWLLTLAK